MKKKAKILYISYGALLAIGLVAAFVFFDALSSSLSWGKKANVILISIDTLRADHLGSYGYKQNSSPNLDRFANEDAILFERCISSAPSTEPSHASIFTSLIPSHHGAFFAKRVPIPDDMITMAEILKKHGYSTVSFNEGGQVSDAWGFAQGFDEYVSLPGIGINHKFGRIVEHALDWLSKNDNETPKFLFLHTFETHHPYTPNERFIKDMGNNYQGTIPNKIMVNLLKSINKREISLSKTDRQHIINIYDAEIRSMDNSFAQLVQGLKDRSLYDETMIIFTSDHGEEFGEHGKMGWHSHSLWNELLHVPLIIKFPGKRFKGKRINPQVRSIDILPTMLDVLKIKPLPMFEGRTMMRLLQGKRDGPRPAVSQQDGMNDARPVTLQTGKWKYYLRNAKGSARLFDLNNDPGEKKNVSKQHPEIFRELGVQLKKILNNRPTPVQGSPIKMKEPLVEKLKALGYLDDSNDGKK